MKCKRLCAWLLCLVMMFSLLPVSAAAKWYGEHNVTVKYVFNDDSPNSKPDDVKKTIASTVGAITTFKVEKAGYNHSAKVTSGNAECSIDGLGFLHVRHVDADSVITVTYTPKGNVITIDQYYNNGTILAEWGTNFKVNGLNIVENNKLEKGAIIDNTELTDATEKYRFLTVGGKTYDFSYARQIPSPGESSDTKLAKVWYERDTGEWYYAHLDNAKFPLGNKSGVNFCYNTPHSQSSKHHDFVATTVDPTCTEEGYTDYECRYCGKTKQDGFTDPLGHDWKYDHDDTTSGADSQHYQVCKRCNEKGITENCRFDLATTETGTHTCTVCGHSYTDEITPTGTFVYVYFKTVHPIDGNVRVNDGDGVTYNNNTGGWATLGRLTTERPVSVSTDKTVVGNLGAEVNKTNPKFVKHQDNENFDLDLISEWVELKTDDGAAGYVKEAPCGGGDVWHLNGQVNVYKLSYDANRPTGVTESVTVPDPAYYLPNWNAPVSTADPTLQGYDFGGWYEDSDCKIKAGEKVTVAEDTSLYAKWTPAQPTADLVDDAITIYHQVNSEADWHGENIGAHMTYNYTDTNAHTVPKAADATISYQATLDMQNLEFGVNPEHADTVFKIKKLMQDAGTTSLWKFMMGNPIVMFTGSEVNLHVKFSDKLDTSSIDWSKLSLTSDWFRLADDYQNGLTQDSNGYWTIPCVIRDKKGTGNSSEITLSGVSLSLTDQAQGELSSGTELDVVSEGYIDGTIKISTKNFNESIPCELSPIGHTGYTYELSLIGMSKEAPAQNTAKLKLATYTVTYDANGGSGTMTDTNSPYAYEVVAKVLTNGFTRSRYTFTGWNTKADGSGKPYAEGDSIEMLGDVVLYAQWTRNSSHDDDDSKTYYYFAIQKVDAQDDHALNGAKFELYQLDKNGKVVNHSETKTRQHRSENGIALFSVDSKNSYDGIWYYAEVTAPEGYVLDSTEHKITKNDFSTSQNEAIRNAKTVQNYRGTTPDLLNGDDHFAYVVGYQDGCVHPNALITRAETATIFFRLLKDSVRDGNLLTSNTFADVPNAYWANTAISTMAGLGIVQGYNSTAFDPNASITRAEFAAICARFDTGKSSGTQTFSDIKGHWAEKYIERAAELGWIKGFEDGTFRPNDCITRAQAMTMINRVLNRIPEDASDLLPDMNVWPDCNPGDWIYLAVQEATNSHDFKHKAGNYETWTGMNKDPDWTRYEN